MPSPREVTDALLARIARLNPLLHAFLTVTADQARAQAATAEARYRDARRDGTLDALPPLLGVPLSVKDLSPVAGVRTTYGSLIYADHLPSETAIAAERLEAAGAVLLGKSNTPEFGTTTVTDNRLGPSCANPWNPGHVAGGSSGGAAAAVAAGLGPLAHGSDGGGSIRVPAAFNGVVGGEAQPNSHPQARRGDRDAPVQHRRPARPHRRRCRPDVAGHGRPRPPRSPRPPRLPRRLPGRLHSNRPA